MRRYVNELQHLEYKLEESAKEHEIEISKIIKVSTEECKKKIEEICQEKVGLRMQLMAASDNFISLQQEHSHVQEKFEVQVK